jgi:hypothetical protein
MNEPPRQEQRNPEEHKVARSVEDPSDVNTKTIRVVKNTDNDALLPCGNRKFVVGQVDELNGVREAAEGHTTKQEQEAFENVLDDWASGRMEPERRAALRAEIVDLLAASNRRPPLTQEDEEAVKTLRAWLEADVNSLRLQKEYVEIKENGNPLQKLLLKLGGKVLRCVSRLRAGLSISKKEEKS